MTNSFRSWHTIPGSKEHYGAPPRVANLFLKDAVDCLHPRERAVIFLSLWKFFPSVMAQFCSGHAEAIVKCGRGGHLKTHVGIVHWSACAWRE